MPPTLPRSILARIKQLASSPEALDLATTRAALLSQQAPLDHISPSAVARSTLLLPSAQRGFSESLLSTRPPFAVQTMRPSEFLANTPPLSSSHDQDIVNHLMESIQKKKLQDNPSLWMREVLPATHSPSHLPSPNYEAAYEGRHRMTALKELQGDEPVPLTLIQGEQFRMQPPDRYSDIPYAAFSKEDMDISPLELIKQRIQFGDTPIQLNPLWTR